MKQHLLATIARHLRPRVIADARRHDLGGEDADDLLQEAFCRLWERRGEYADAAHAEGAMVLTVRRLMADTLRRRQVRRALPIDEVDIPDTTAEAEADERLSRIIRIIDTRLSERERTALMMREQRDMEYDEIADELGITVENARIIISRTRRKVRDIYNSL